MYTDIDGIFLEAFVRLVAFVLFGPATLLVVEHLLRTLSQLCTHVPYMNLAQLRNFDKACTYMYIYIHIYSIHIYVYMSTLCSSDNERAGWTLQ